MMPLHHRNLSRSHQIWGSIVYADGGTESAFFALDHWVKKGKHSFFIQPYAVPAHEDVHLDQIISSYATSAIQSQTSVFEETEIELETIDWFMVIQASDEIARWVRVVFDKFHEENAGQLKQFPQANDALLFGAPRILDATSKIMKNPTSDKDLSAFQYRKLHLDSLKALGTLADEAIGPLIQRSQWRPPKGYDVDCGHLLKTRVASPDRALFARRSKKLLSNDLAEANVQHAGSTVVIPIQMLGTGFYGAVLEKTEVHDWTMDEEGPEVDPIAVKHEEKTKPTWRGEWRSSIHGFHRPWNW
jgi:hypothetical protein